MSDVMIIETILDEIDDGGDDGGIMSQVEQRWMETIEYRRSCWGSNLVE